MPHKTQNNQVVTSQHQGAQQPPQQMGGPERHTIWHGVLEWIERPKNSSDQQKVTKHAPCQVSSRSKDGEPEMKANGWPPKLTMKLLPKQLIGAIGGSYLKGSKSVLFHPAHCDALDSLTRVMNSGFMGCVDFTASACDIKVLIILYAANMKAYLGFIPNNQAAFVDRLQMVNLQQISTQLRQGAQQPTKMGGRERHTIWHGVLEWIERPKNSSDQQKVTKHAPCQVSSSSKDGEPEMKANGWPPKLIMQLLPKHLIGILGGSYLKNSKSVLFHPTHCDALDSLTRAMNSGFAGCVHFTSAACDIKVLILLYAANMKAYLGFIPNNQVAFVNRLRRVLQQQKSTKLLQESNGQSTNTQDFGQMPMQQMISHEGTPDGDMDQLGQTVGQHGQYLNQTGAGSSLEQAGNAMLFQ